MPCTGHFGGGFCLRGIGTPAAQHTCLNLGPPVQVNLTTVMPGPGDTTYFTYVGPATLTSHMDTRSELALPATGNPSPDNAAAFLKAVLFLTGGPGKAVSSATLRCMQRETCEPHSHILWVFAPCSAGRPTSLVLGRGFHVDTVCCHPGESENIRFASYCQIFPKFTLAHFGILRSTVPQDTISLFMPT